MHLHHSACPPTRSLVHVVPCQPAASHLKAHVRIARNSSSTDLPSLVASICLFVRRASSSVRSRSGNDHDRWDRELDQLHRRDPSSTPERSGLTLHKRIDSRNSRRLPYHESLCISQAGLQSRHWYRCDSAQQALEATRASPALSPVCRPLVLQSMICTSGSDQQRPGRPVIAAAASVS